MPAGESPRSNPTCELGARGPHGVSHKRLLSEREGWQEGSLPGGRPERASHRRVELPRQRLPPQGPPLDRVHVQAVQPRGLDRGQQPVRRLRKRRQLLPGRGGHLGARGGRGGGVEISQSSVSHQHVTSQSSSVRHQSSASHQSESLYHRMEEGGGRGVVGGESP